MADYNRITALLEDVIPALGEQADKMLNHNSQFLKDDVLSDTFEKIFKSFDSYDPDKGPFRIWALEILKNTTIDHLRKQKRRSEPMRDEDGESESFEECLARHGVMSEDFTASLQDAEATEEDLNLIEEFFRATKPGQSFCEWYDEDGTWYVFLVWGYNHHLMKLVPKVRRYKKRFRKGSKREHPGIVLLRKVLRGAHGFRESIEKESGKTRAAVYTEISRLKKDISPSRKK